MNMLIIGNGFDLAHERPTKYEHFLQFLKLIHRANSFYGNEREFTASMNTEQLSDHVHVEIISCQHSNREYRKRTHMQITKNLLFEKYIDV